MRKAPNETLVAEVRELLDQSWNAERENRVEALRDLRFMAGDQWPDYIRREREAENRPVLTINRLPQFVYQVANEIRLNPPSIRVVPVDGETDKAVADIYTGLLRDIQYRSRAKHVFSTAAMHAIICGVGWMRVDTQYENDESFDQEVRIRRIPDPLSVYIDPAAVEPDGSDAKYVIVSALMPIDDFKAAHPDASPSEIEAPSDTTAESTLYWTSRDFVRVAEYWRKVPITRTLAQLADGAVLDITDIPRDQMQLLPPVVRERKVEKFKIIQDLVSGADVLSERTEWAGQHLPFVRVVGTEIPLDKFTLRHGLIRFARDPQQLYNYWRSAAAEMIALAPKAPYLVTMEQIGPYKTLWDTLNTKNRPYLPYKPDPEVPGGAPQRMPQAEIPAAMLQESALASDDMKATTGLYDASLGQRSNEQSGRAILARQREGDMASYHYSDNLVLSLEHLGRILVDLVPRIYDAERTVRILDDDEREEFVPINRVVQVVDGAPILEHDLSKGRYDVRVKIGPSNTTRRIEAADSMMQFIQAFPQAAPLVGDLIAESMDWPGSDKIAERLRRAVPPQILGEGSDGQQDAPPQQQIDPQQVEMQQEAMQMARERALAELRKKEADAAKAMADAERAAMAVEAQRQNSVIGY